MSVSRVPTRQRIVNTALELFASKGITETTTRQIADFAQVNEVTLFRHFGNKHGLLLAVLQECLEKYLVLAQAGESLMISDISSQSDLRRFLKYYIQSSLRAIESVPELVRSLVGEAGQYPLESRQALAEGINQVNQTIATAINDVLINSRSQYYLAPIKLANLLNTCILGYAVITLTTDVQSIWHDRDEFVNTLVDMFVQDLPPISQAQVSQAKTIVDIPAEIVREILLEAKKSSAKDYAIAYLLFGAGLTKLDLTNLRLQDYQIQTNHGILRIGHRDHRRSVPINQKILGHRYGSVTNNPLSNYLKTRESDLTANRKKVKTLAIIANPVNSIDADSLFLGSSMASKHQSLSLQEIQKLWDLWTEKYCNFDGSPLAIEQTRNTWCIEMLARGIDADSFCIISGINPKELQAYQVCLNQKLAIEKAIALDS
jgi:AcrR family transcriptional regulator